MKYRLFVMATTDRDFYRSVVVEAADLDAARKMAEELELETIESFNELDGSWKTDGSELADVNVRIVDLQSNRLIPAEGEPISINL